MRKNQTTKAIQYLFAALATAMLLAACGPQTLFTANVDVMTFLPADDLQGDAPIQGGYDLKIPDDDQGIDGSEFSIPTEIFDNLNEFKIDLVSRFTLDESVTALDAEIAIYIAASAPIYAGEPAIKLPLTLVPGEAQDAPLSITISEESDPTLFNLLKSGDFRLGASYTSTGDAANSGSMSAELVSFDISLSTDIAKFTTF